MRAWRRNQYHLTSQYFKLSFFLFALVAATFSVYVLYLDVSDTWPGGFTSLLTFMLLAAVLSGANAVLAMNLDRHRDFASRWAHRSDFLLARLIPTVSTFYRARSTWHHAAICKRLRFRLLEMAREVSVTRVRTRRTNFTLEWRIRREIKVENLRLAAVLRQHADSLAKAGRQGEYDQICDSLLAGLVAASHDDWDALLEHAPEITNKSLVVRLATRLTPAVILLAAALLVPLLPAFRESGDSIRGVLLPMAGLAAVGASESVTGPVRSLLEKIAFSGK